MLLLMIMDPLLGFVIWSFSIGGGIFLVFLYNSEELPPPNIRYHPPRESDGRFS